MLTQAETAADFRSMSGTKHILRETMHRPWPLPASPWAVRQEWRDLLFLHWPVAAQALRARVPEGLIIDTYEGQAWLGVVPFEMAKVAPRGWPALPGVLRFAELNVRTYVRIGDTTGVFFFSLDASSLLAVCVARVRYRLPYFWAGMRVTRTSANTIDYTSHRRGTSDARFEATYSPAGRAFTPARGSLEHFLTERYCLFTTDRRRRLFRADIHHPPWSLQAAEADVRRNTMAAATGVMIPSTPPLCHYAKRQAMVNWPLVLIES
jgi:uncharacterized protein YqjF (DUF2071 family)